MKGFIATSVARPIGVAVFALAVALFGIVSLRQLSVDLLPKVDVPRISITTQYEGVAPPEIETLITRPLEQSLSTVEGLDTIEAVSSEGLSRIQLQFAWGTELETALDDVRVAIDRLRAVLPEDAEPPSVYKFDLASVPVLFLGLTGPGEPRRLKYLATDELSRALERVPGVAAVDVNGGRDREIRVALDSHRLSALGVSARQVSDALARENRTLSAGDLRASGREVVIRTAGEFESLAEVESVVVATKNQVPIQVKDVASVEDTTRKLRGELWIDGKPGIRLRVNKQSGANSIEVADGVRREIERLNAEYAGRAKLTVLWDSSEFIRASVDNVQSSGATGALLALLALLLFLRSMRATLVVATAIPLSILATFALMYFQGMTLNIISFGGLALGIGMLVDGAIVILENIYRTRDEGASASESAVRGAKEVAGAVIAGTLTTLSVFVPVVFIGGFAGIFFGEMALVVTFSLLCSLVVALSLVPSLAARLLLKQSKGSENKLSAALERWFSKIETGYGRLLQAALHAPWAVVVGAVILFASSILLVPQVGSELMPQADEGELDIDIELPVGTPLETTADVMQRLEKKVLSTLKPGELAHVMTTAGPEAWWRPGGSHEGEIELMLVAAGQRERSIAEIEAGVRPAVQGIPGAKVEVRQKSSNILTRIIRRGDDRLAVEIRGHDLQTADELAAKVSKLLLEIPGVTYARSDREIGQLERVLHVDRERAAEHGLGSADIAEAVETYLLGSVATRYRERGDEFDIRVQLKEEQRARLAQLDSLPIVTPTGKRIQLGSLVTVKEQRGPSSISRVDQERTLRVNAGVADRPIGEVGADFRKALEQVAVPDGFSIQLSGELAEQQDTLAGLLLGLLLAAFLVYATMAVQFESLRQPLVIMASVPFAFVGVVMMLLATGTTFNMYSLLGMIVLVGIVVNNAIVLVDAANQLRQTKGVALDAALVQAGSRRLRPIVMTTLTTLLGLLPLSLSAAEGSDVQAPLARAVVGGLSTSTLVTLLLVPCLYALVERRRDRAAQRQTDALPVKAA